jgi:hypothetical protein
MALLVVLLQMMVMYIPGMSHFFDVLPLKWHDLSIAIGAGLIVLMAMELEKKFRK